MTATHDLSTTFPEDVPVCIPARWGSSRFPGKLLEPWGDGSVLDHSIRTARGSGLGPVVVLAADALVEEAARAWEPEVHVFRSTREALNGSERIAAAIEAGQLGEPAPSEVLNLQGDAVGAEPQLLACALQALRDDPESSLATVAVSAPAQAHRGRTTLRQDAGRAVVFSREALTEGGRVLLHVGIYAYRVPGLLEVAALQPGPREQAESLEQLRWLEHGFPIAVRVVEGSPDLARAVDRRSDLG